MYVQSLGRGVKFLNVMKNYSKKKSGKNCNRCNFFKLVFFQPTLRESSSILFLGGFKEHSSLASSDVKKKVSCFLNPFFVGGCCLTKPKDIERVREVVERFEQP